MERFYRRQFVSDVINELILFPNVKKANNYYKWNLIVTDPDDNKFVDCALNAVAEYIVTNGDWTKLQGFGGTAGAPETIENG